MFELGLRLAFDKPTIIVNDDKTGYSFDTAPIEHLSYPRDLSYFKIVEFKTKLKEKIQGTIKKSQEDPLYSPFLKSFGEFKVANIEHKEGSINDVILQRLDDMQQEIGRLTRPSLTGISINRISDSEKERNDITDIIVRDKINQYVTKTKIQESELFENKNNERKKLQDFLEKDKFLCDLCGSEQRLQKVIDKNLFPF